MNKTIKNALLTSLALGLTILMGISTVVFAQGLAAGYPDADSLPVTLERVEQTLVDANGVTVFPNGQQIVRVADESPIQVFDSTENATIEINVESPIMDLVGHTVDVDVQQLVEALFNITSQDNQLRTATTSFVQDDAVLVAHQERIDEILALVSEQGIDNLDDLFLLLDEIQSGYDYVPITPLWCASGTCHVVPVWVWVDGVRLAGYQCRDCGRVFIFFG